LKRHTLPVCLLIIATSCAAGIYYGLKPRWVKECSYPNSSGPPLTYSKAIIVPSVEKNDESEWRSNPDVPGVKRWLKYTADEIVR
jgi:hypothetical protein